MKSATRQMAEEYDRIQKRAAEDPGTAGDQGEENWATLLRNWLPHTFHIVTKGRILSYKGIAGPQIDILILQPEYPTHLLDKKLYLAGGVVAAFECKVTLKAHHITEFTKHSKEIKEHIFEETGTPYKELQGKIIYGLLAHSHSWKGIKSNPVDNITNQIYNTNLTYINHPKQMPDLICVADLAFWNGFKSVDYMSKAVATSPGYFTINQHDYHASTGYFCFASSTLENQKFKEFITPIGMLISALFGKISWQYPSLKNLAEYFLQSLNKGIGNGMARKWEASIYSDNLKRKLESGQYLSNDTWDEWSKFII
ncbi:DUF6602 domain-containing protein [Hymenobacter artigasi]|uniref:DUF6602 domain-containing protein n=1 Tax=Hymenobacter artigasi TaxID=2719616 RepID=A0ABX1HHW1_9BACT|nr:DUF6602 domain-containing protein [Hymenobacter artigasi]NKI89440.1 hypothetical protein [Hymenobacter artigasi]